MQALKRFVKQFVKEDFSYEGIQVQGREYYLQNKHIEEITQDIDEFSFGSGLYLGQRKGASFQASINMLKIIAKKTNKKIELDEHSAWLFICGRDIFIENAKIIGDSSKQELFIVQNQDEEILGLTKRTTISGKQMFKNLYDIGNFLRREQ